MSAAYKALAEGFSGKRLTEITPAAVERYKAGRLVEHVSARAPPTTQLPSTASWPVSSICSMWRRKGHIAAYQGAYLWRTRWATVKFLDEQNLRDRVLTLEEFQRMVDACARVFEIQC